jgi:Ca-activated chloride channel family protein
MSFAAPLVLVALVAIPLLIQWYTGQQRRRTRAATAFVTAPLRESVAPRPPRWRRHAPMLAFALAVAVLILAAARPQRSVAVPISDGAVMLINDTSNSMAATDVSPSREAAALNADRRFLAGVPSSIRVGLLEFARRPVLLQSPTTDRALTTAALAQPPHFTGATATGDAIDVSAQVLAGLRSASGKPLPSAIVLISDGGANAGASPTAAARQAGAQHIPVYTITVGTPHGTITGKRGTATVTEPVPVDSAELTRMAQVSGGRAFTAGDAGGLSSVYAHLAAQLGHKQVKQEITSSFAGAGLVLLLFGGVMSLRFFGRLV